MSYGSTRWIFRRTLQPDQWLICPLPAETSGHDKHYPGHAANNRAGGNSSKRKAETPGTCFLLGKLGELRWYWEQAGGSQGKKSSRLTREIHAVLFWSCNSKALGQKAWIRPQACYQFPGLSKQPNSLYICTVECHLPSTTSLVGIQGLGGGKWENLCPSVQQWHL